MSYTFAVQPQRTPTFQEVLHGLEVAYSTYATDDDGQLRGSWYDGGLQVHIPQRSTRGVGVSLECGTFLVRLNTLASTEDWVLALDMVERLAVASNGRIEPEDDNMVSPRQLRDKCDAAWIAQQVNASVEVLLAIIDERGTARLPGPIREFCAGPRMKAEWMASGARESLPERVLDAARRVQYVDGTRWYFASAIVVGEQRGERRARVTAFGPDVNYLMPPIEYLAVLPGIEGANHVFIRQQALPYVAASHFEWLDELQCLVRAFARDAWPTVVARAQEWQVEMFPEQS